METNPSRLWANVFVCFFFHPLQPHLAGLKMDDVDKGDIGNDGRQKGVFYNLYV